MHWTIHNFRGQEFVMMNYQSYDVLLLIQIYHQFLLLFSHYSQMSKHQVLGIKFQALEISLFEN